jgi:hypothetical protein
MSTTLLQKNILPKQRVLKILSKFSKKKILVFGDVGLDKYTIGKVFGKLVCI